MSPKRKVRTRSSTNNSNTKETPVSNVNEGSPNPEHTCAKRKVNQPVRKTPGSSKKTLLQKPAVKTAARVSSRLRVQRKTKSKENPSSLEPIEETKEESTTKSNLHSLQDSASKATLNESQVISRPVRQKAKKRRIFSTDSDENPIASNLPLGSKESNLPEKEVTVSPKHKSSSKRRKLFSDESEAGTDSPSKNDCVPIFSTGNFSESSPKKRKLSEGQGYASSESERNSNKELFVISDSELNNYINSDNELIIPTSAYSEEGNENCSNLNVHTEPKSEGGTLEKSNVTCIYKDPQLETLDGDSHAVVFYQAQLAAALEWHLHVGKVSKNSYFTEHSPTDKLGPTLSEIHPDVYLSPPSDLQSFTKDTSPLTHPHVNGHVSFELHDSRLLPDVSLSPYLGEAAKATDVAPQEPTITDNGSQAPSESNDPSSNKETDVQSEIVERILSVDKPDDPDHLIIFPDDDENLDYEPEVEPSIILSKPVEAEIETELEEEDAWSEVPSPDKNEPENLPLKRIPSIEFPVAKEKAPSDKKFSLSEDDSDSESEHSFKRSGKKELEGIFKRAENGRVSSSERIFNGHENNNIPDPCSPAFSSAGTSKSYDSTIEGCDFTSESPDLLNEDHFQDNYRPGPNEVTGKIDDVLRNIVCLCEKGDLREACSIAKNHIVISSPDIQKKIFQELFWHVMNFINHRKCNFRPDFSAEMLSGVLDIFHDFNLYDPGMCSMIISKCLIHSISISHAVDMFEVCQKHSIPLEEATLVSYIKYLNSKESSIEAYLAFLEYVKCCGKFILPGPTLHQALVLFLNKTEGQSLPALKRICGLLCSEVKVDERDIKNFITCCVERDCWLEIARCFNSWSKNSEYCHSLHQAIAYPIQSAGMHYGKFAAALHDGVDSLPLNLTHLFGQIGVALMLEAYQKDETQAALEVLYTMSKYKINYFEQQKNLLEMVFIEALLRLQDAPELAFPSTVAFAAVDIYMQTAKPKEAFAVLKSFSKSLPKNLNEKIKSKITPQLFRYFLKLSQILHQIDPLNKGLEAFDTFLSALETDVSQKLKEVTVNNMNDIRTVYLQNSVTLLNAERIWEAVGLFHRCASFFQEEYKPQKFIVRGLLTATYLHGMKDEAHKMFQFGSMKKIYRLAKLDKEACAWMLYVESCWTKTEIKFTLKSFLEDKSRFFILHKQKNMGENMFTLQIQFMPDSREFSPGLNCLKVPSDFDAALERVSIELRVLDPNFLWEVDPVQKALKVYPHSLYEYWERKFPDLPRPKEDTPPQSFLIKGNMRYSFGAKFPENSPTHGMDRPYVSRTPSPASVSPVTSPLKPSPKRPPVPEFAKPSPPKPVVPEFAKPSPPKPVVPEFAKPSPPKPVVPEFVKLSPPKHIVPKLGKIPTKAQDQNLKPVKPRRVFIEPVIKNQEEFQKVVSFVKTRVFLKCKHLSTDEQNAKAAHLAKAFFTEHKIEQKLDKKTMKLLNDYTEKNIHL